MMDNSELIDLIAKLDASYEPIPDVSTWPRDGISTSKWAARSDALKHLKTKATTNLWENAVDIALRVAAVDTGALEGLYETDWGFTFSIATQTIAINSREKERYEEIKSYFEAQLQGYKLTLDAITKNTKVTEAWIRALHEVLTSAQEEYTVITPQGPGKKKLEKGTYKVDPNHVLDRDKKPFSYAPVLQVKPEMERLIRNLHSTEFEALHPAIQSAYAHYVFVKIHPFADGNGRVARALASYYLMRSDSIPLLILVDQRNEYINALQKADRREYQSLNTFVFSRGIGAMQIVEDFIKAGEYKDTEESIEKISGLYLAREGVEHSELDDLGERLFAAARDELAQEAKTVQAPVSYEVVTTEDRYGNAPSGYRVLVKRNRPVIRLSLSTRAPASATLNFRFVLYVTKGNIQPDGDLIIVGDNGEHRIGATVEDIRHPSRSGISGELKLRLKAWAIGVLRHALDNLRNSAEEAFNASGYGEK